MPEQTVKLAWCGCGSEVTTLGASGCWGASCNRCPAETRDYDTEPEAIAAWNRERAAEEMERALEPFAHVAKQMRTAPATGLYPDHYRIAFGLGGDKPDAELRGADLEAARAALAHARGEGVE